MSLPSRTRHRAHRAFALLGRGSLLLVLVGNLAACSDGSPKESATRSSVADPAGDVVVGGLGRNRESVVADPKNTITDILATTVEHGPEAVTVEVVFDNLRPRQYLDLTANLTTDSTGSHLPTQATALTYRGESTFDVYTDGRSRCATADDAVAFDYETNTVTMTVPRRCLGEPRWIEAQVRAATMVYDAPPDDPRTDAVWEDDAYRTALHPPAGYGTSARLYHR